MRWWRWRWRRLSSGMHIPPNLLLQWHITNRCNQRCAHCYHEKYTGDEPDFAMLLRILQQFISLLQQLSDHQGQPVQGHVTVTGGEPFLHDNFLDLLDIFAQNRKIFSFAILTNGSLIDSALAKKLKKLHPDFVQVSLEGTPETHNRIRGAGNYEQTVKAAKMLVRHGVRTFIAFTAHKVNFKEFPHVAKAGRRVGVARVWADRLIPHGQGEMEGNQPLTATEHQDFLEIMHKERNKKGFFWRRKTEIAMHRALQFLVAGGRPYHCTAGDSLITVMPNGDLYPCRRMPIRVGNLKEKPLANLYQESELLHKLRDQKRIPVRCAACLHKCFCRGGLRCLSYALTGNPFAGDPDCWLQRDGDI